MPGSDARNAPQDVVVLFNPHSGIGVRPSEMIRALGETWDAEPGINLCYQESRSVADGIAKTQRAIERGVDTIIVIGGDGMINTIGSQLVDTGVKLAVVPAGSGNGFARHFDIAIRPEKAAAQLLQGRVMEIDIGYVNDRPFFVTASLAWDAELVTGFEKFPIRGIGPYVFAGIYKYFTYEPQLYRLVVDGREIELNKPLVLTVANLTQYGGGAKIAPDARADDGLLTLVAVPHMEPHELIPQVHRLFDGSINKIPDLQTFSFSETIVHRKREDPVQVDGELMDAGTEVVIRVKPRALKVIVPQESDRSTV